MFNDTFFETLVENYLKGDNKAQKEKIKKDLKNAAEKSKQNNYSKVVLDYPELNMSIDVSANPNGGVIVNANHFPSYQYMLNNGMNDINHNIISNTQFTPTPIMNYPSVSMIRELNNMIIPTNPMSMMPIHQTPTHTNNKPFPIGNHKINVRDYTDYINNNPNLDVLEDGNIVKVKNPKRPLFFSVIESSRLQQPITNEINSIINFILKYFNFELDEKGFICIDVSNDPNMELLQRTKVDGRFMNVNKEFMKAKGVIYFNPVVNLSLTRFLFDLFLQKARIETYIFYIANNTLYLKDNQGKVFYNSLRYNYNTNLCYLDIIFRLNCIDIDLSRWDVDNYVEVLV